MDSQLNLLLFMSVDRRWANVDKAASAAIFLEDAAPVGLLSTLLVASVAESSKYCFWGGGGGGHENFWEFPAKMAKDLLSKTIAVTLRT